MTFEKFPSKEEKTIKESHLFDGISTPKINTNNPGTDLHLEAHAATSREIDESLVEETRGEIIGHYGIDANRVISIPATEGTKRKIRAFMIVERREEEGNDKGSENDKYFADGHTPHADLLRELFKRFPELGELEAGNKIPDNFLEKWVTKKGFIDPNANGFKNFSEIRFAFERLILEKNKDKLTEDEKIEVESDEVDLPNWFMVGEQISR
ncbi:MAG: hypothetical protein PHQ42_00830 [Patescibacteria group bacterium]|nr:hypothetical protein [Patescibacteria group bacterium]